MTIFFRNLANVTKDLSEITTEAIFKYIGESFYKKEEITGEILEKWVSWFGTYLKRLQLETASDEERKNTMNLVNPKYVLRNYMAQLAIDAADEMDFSLVKTLYDLLQNPYEEQPQFEEWFAKRPEWARQKVGCSMLSCSS